MIWNMLRFKCVHDGYPSNRKSGRKCNGVDEKGREGMDVLLVGEYLKQNGYSDSFRGGYLMSMAMSIWSTPLGDCDPGLSAHFVIYFMHYHHLLRLTGKAKYYHRWKVSPPSLFPFPLLTEFNSIQYVKNIIARMPRGTFRHSTPIQSVTSIPQPTQPGKHKVLLRTST
ncbi:hypothetical protein CPB86DRAFT_147032 [Serendipita vermifera]|nr:hypothetical protein CPB86DRAFT_147032 [Serendipita vermifera]